MLVLSRKANQKVYFPTLGTTVQVLEIRGGVVRIGIDAPPEVPVRRAEVPDRRDLERPSGPVTESAAGDVSPEEALAVQLGERLQDASAGLGLVRLLLDAGQEEDARSTLAALHQEFQLVLHGVAGEAPEAPAAPGPKRPKALLVEDDGNQRELLAALLRHSGLEVDTAGDGADALDYLRSHGRPDLLLLDMGLPRVDGPTVVRKLRGDPAYAGLRIYGVSGRGPDDFDLERGPAGVDGWFRKPVDTAVLLQDLAGVPSGGR
jgi:carbon storage regulator CsrA